MRAITFEELPATVGQTITGEPLQISATDSEHFHKATWLDEAYPDGDVGEFPDEIVEGFLLLGVLDALLRFATGRDDSTMWGLNYGLDKVRFVAPVHFGELMIPTFETLQVLPKDEGFKVLRRCTFELAESGDTVMVADWWTYALPRGTVERARRDR
jgi:acyl dehydratase